jgi:hypothetical protein
MAASAILAAKQQEAFKQIRENLQRHHVQAAERLNRYAPAPGAVPNSIKSPQHLALFMAESLQIITELLDPILEERKPKRRGRPPKADKVA